MKKIVIATLAATALSVPALSIAQQVGGVSRTQVRAELVAAEQAGYRPNADYNSYPTAFEATSGSKAVFGSVGSSAAGHYEAGAGASIPTQSPYFGQ